MHSAFKVCSMLALAKTANKIVIGFEMLGCQLLIRPIGIRAGNCYLMVRVVINRDTKER